MKDEMTSELNL